MAASTTTNNNTSKTCFVTIGATATFTALIQRVLAAPFISALKSQGYTQLVVQYGAAGKPIYESAVQQAKTAGGKALSVSGFDLDKAGLGKHMRQAKGGRAGAGEGVVVSHAGMFFFPYLTPLSKTIGFVRDVCLSETPLAHATCVCVCDV